MKDANLYVNLEKPPKEVLEDTIRDLIKLIDKTHNMETHEIKVYGYFNPALQKVEYAVKADIRTKGELFYGQQSS